jgi:hypothetical protein
LSKIRSLPALAAIFLVGCSAVSSHVGPDAHLDHVQHVFVEQNPGDGRNIDQLIARGLRDLGYDAAAGPLTMSPDGTDVIVSYDDEWTYDFTTYMISLQLRVRDARTAAPLADSKIFRPSVTGQAPSAMIGKALRRIFKPRIPPAPQTIEASVQP